MRLRLILPTACAFFALCTAAPAQRVVADGFSKIRIIYIIPSSHWDLGFKLPPEEQLDDIKPHLDAVIRTAKQDPEFHWVVESTWQVQAWLDRTKDPQLIQDGEFYSFTFPFQFASPAKVMVDDGVGFHDSLKDLLPGARTDGVTPIHTLALVNTEDASSTSVSLLEREDFYNIPLRYPGVNGVPGAFLNEVRLDALRKADQGDMADVGVVTLPTVEPGYGPRYTSSIAITSSRTFDPVIAYRQGWEFDVPLMVATLPMEKKPRTSSESFFSVSAPNVAVLAFRPSADGSVDHYMMRLQEVAGHEQEFALVSALKIAGVEETTMTEDRTLKTGLSTGNLSIGEHETLTLRLTIPHKNNDWKAEAQ